MDARLIIGCDGLRRNRITFCPGTQNQVLDLRKLGEHYREIVDSFDIHYKLFDGKLYGSNETSNVLQYLKDLGKIEPANMKIWYDYMGMHRYCKPYLVLESIEGTELK